MAPMTEVELLGEAIDGTEKEIFSESLGNEPLEENGDRSLEEMTEPADEDVADEDDEGADEGELRADADDDEQPRDERGRFTSQEPEQPQARTQPQQREPQRQEQQPQRQAQRVPVSELLEERRARQAAEARVAQLQTESTAITQRFTTLEQRLDALLQRQQQPPQPQQPDPATTLPDEAYVDGRTLAERESRLMQQFDQRLTNQRVEMSFANAHEQHGQRFEQAYQDLTAQNPQDPVARSTVQSIMSAPNPGAALMRWHNNHVIAREVGGDPNAYRERIKSELAQDPEFRQQLIAELRQQAGGPSPRHVVRAPQGRRSPPSLNEASGSNVQVRDPNEFDDSDRGAFDYAFAK